ncbi:MAG: hypothetical protein HYU66_17495 [Armatimonadetes bacterium]|nr:hypothetical protein [Armatimonadota bacterium]
MKRLRKVLTCLLLALPLLCSAAGCKKSDKGYDEIGAPAADVNAIRQESRERKARGEKPVAPPADAPK